VPAIFIVFWIVDDGDVDDDNVVVCGVMKNNDMNMILF
jgi:hypothetical protein